MSTKHIVNIINTEVKKYKEGMNFIDNAPVSDIDLYFEKDILPKLITNESHKVVLFSNELVSLFRDFIQNQSGLFCTVYNESALSKRIFDRFTEIANDIQGMRVGKVVSSHIVDFNDEIYIEFADEMFLN